MFMKYMRNDLNDDYGIIDLQEKLLEFSNFFINMK